LAGVEFDSTKRLLSVVRDITGFIDQADLESVFGTWERRLSECIQRKAEYII
jgi:hypothetical protein